MSQRLPLFPLGAVLVPGEVLPLHVFEPRYLDLVRDVLDDASHPDGRDGSVSRFGVLGIRRGHEVGAHRLAELYDVGCAAEVLEIDRNADGTLDLVTVGRERFRLDALDGDAGTAYLTGQVEWLDEPSTVVEPALTEQVRTEFLMYCERLGMGRDGTASSSALEDPVLLSYVVTASMLLHLPERQNLLAAPDARVRLRRALSLLRRERVLWQVAASVPAVDLARRAPDQG
ncbi:LON peptidase substrate-binding domain-containing protein [Angustibacter sp. McL0619]|uniref:LON peptidase substrate-binding domain-containing protein n=1 Tax=Angustibacter sp. McL0619 TaxID=3415676 RepID=UPI003CF2F9BD